MIIPVGKRIRILSDKVAAPYQVGDEGTILDGCTVVTGGFIKGVKQPEFEHVTMQVRMDRTGEICILPYHARLAEILT